VRFFMEGHKIQKIRWLYLLIISKTSDGQKSRIFGLRVMD